MAKLKVGFDVGVFSSGHKNRGIGFYSQHLIENLQKIDSIEVIEITNQSDQNVDLIHYPTFDLFKRTLPLVKPKPVVVTVHDVIPLVFPDAYPPGLRGKVNYHIQRQSLQGAKAVITDSQSSAKDIEKLLKIPKERIHSIPLAPGDQFKEIEDQRRLEKVRQKYNLPGIFAIYIGNVNWNKNLSRMAEAANQAGVELVMVGGGFDQNLSGHIELKPYRDFLMQFGDDQSIRRLGFIEDQELVELLNLATVCLYTTLYEGFGLPILEAQAAGTPVITSQSSSMPEVGGDGAVYVDPTNVEAIAESLKKVVSDRRLQQNLAKKGFANVAKFSWAKTATQTAELYHRVVGSASE